MAADEDEHFERKIIFRHAVGTMESVTIQNCADPSGLDDGWRLTISAPAGDRVGAFLDDQALDELVGVLLDLRDARARISTGRVFVASAPEQRHLKSGRRAAHPEPASA